MAIAHLSLILSLVAAFAPERTFAQGGGNTTFTFTTSFTETIFPTLADQRIDTFLTRIIGRINAGATVYDMSFNQPLSDPLVQAAILQAQADLSASAAPTPLTFTGPPLTGSLSLPAA